MDWPVGGPGTRRAQVPLCCLLLPYRPPYVSAQACCRCLCDCLPVLPRMSSLRSILTQAVLSLIHI
eukprot:4574725-Alexandrium_andersonii.AAC.1